VNRTPRKNTRNTTKHRVCAIALLAVVGAVVIAGCGGGGSSSSGAETSASGGGESSAVNTASGSGTIATGQVEGLGTVLVDSSGMTVYEFTEDSGTKSNCYGECEAAWPPVTASGKPTAGEGAMASALGTTKRKDGTLQVTYEGHPLYTFAEDSAPGEANGNEAEGTWFVLGETGSPIKGQATGSAKAETESESAPATEESEESSGGGGYGY
jgi:predicted lipoprotein with Yx(FWY)xxD motif